MHPTVTAELLLAAERRLAAAAPDARLAIVDDELLELDRTDPPLKDEPPAGFAHVLVGRRVDGRIEFERVVLVYDARSGLSAAEALVETIETPERAATLAADLYELPIAGFDEETRCRWTRWREHATGVLEAQVAAGNERPIAETLNALFGAACRRAARSNWIDGPGRAALEALFDQTPKAA